VYWSGIDDFRLIERCVGHCAQRTPTLLDHEASAHAQPAERVG
jgi:hypothetical protein